MRRPVLLFALLYCIAFNIQAQTDSVKSQKSEFHLGGYIDLFYSYDFNQPETRYRQAFFYNYNRHNEINLNMGYIKASVIHPKYRANLALQAGTYPNDNYASEPDLLKSLFEANAGIALDRKHLFWIDAGIFASHLGFESVNAFDNATLTRSIMADNSPYYLTGAKLTYTPGTHWLLIALVCNGWQTIERIEGNTKLSVGTQIQYRTEHNMLFNWSSFIGSNDPDSTRRNRIYNNIYTQLPLSDKIDLTLGYDLGIQQEIKDSNSYDTWYGAVLIASWAINDQWTTAIRGEYYHDPQEVIIQTGPSQEFKTSGFSLNLDYNPYPPVLCRLEGRWLNSRDAIFTKGDSLSQSNFFITTSLSIRLN
jgi:hypothetical protein